MAETKKPSLNAAGNYPVPFIIHKLLTNDILSKSNIFLAIAVKIILKRGELPTYFYAFKNTVFNVLSANLNGIRL